MYFCIYIFFPFPEIHRNFFPRKHSHFFLLACAATHYPHMPDSTVSLQASTPRPCRPTPRRACCVRGAPPPLPPSSTGGGICLHPFSLSSCCSWLSWLPPSGPFSRHFSWHCWSQVPRCSRRLDEAEEVTGGEGGGVKQLLSHPCASRTVLQKPSPEKHQLTP